MNKSNSPYIMKKFIKHVSIGNVLLEKSINLNSPYIMKKFIKPVSIGNVLLEKSINFF